MGFILGVIIWVLRLLSIALLLYFVIGFVAPDSTIIQKAKTYLEPVLAPFRGLLQKYLPQTQKLSFDVSPLATVLVIEIVMWLLKLIRGIF